TGELWKFRRTASRHVRRLLKRAGDVLDDLARRPLPRRAWRSPGGPCLLAGDDQLLHRIFACLESRVDIRHRSSLPRTCSGRSYSSSGGHGLSSMKALRIRKRVFICDRSVDRWHRYVEQSQVDEQLSTMVIPVIK